MKCDQKQILGTSEAGARPASQAQSPSSWHVIHANTHAQPCRELGWCLLPDVNIVWPWLCSAIPLSLRLVRISTWASFSIALRKCCLKHSYFDQSAPTREWGSGKSMLTHCSIREAWCRTGEGMNNVTEEVMKEGWVELAQGLEV